MFANRPLSGPRLLIAREVMVGSLSKRLFASVRETLFHLRGSAMKVSFLYMAETAPVDSQTISTKFPIEFLSAVRVLSVAMCTSRWVHSGPRNTPWSCAHTLMIWT